MARAHRRTRNILKDLAAGREVSEQRLEALERRATTYSNQIAGLQRRIVRSRELSDGQLARRGAELKNLQRLEHLTGGFRA